MLRQHVLHGGGPGARISQPAHRCPCPAHLDLAPIPPFTHILTPTVRSTLETQLFKKAKKSKEEYTFEFS